MTLSKNTHRIALMLAFVSALFLSPAPASASIPDADIHASNNQVGFGAFDGAYGRVQFGLSGRSAIGAYAGTDHNDLYFGDFGSGDRRFDSDLLVGGHYMVQFVEGVNGNPNVAFIAGAFANRAGLRPELGLALSVPFASRWVGRVNAVYGPSWGIEAGYNFTPNVQGTFGVTGMGLVGLNVRF